MNAPLRWETSVQFVKGIGPMKAALFKKIGVETVEDLLLYLPYRYEDRTRMKKVSELVPNEQQTFSGEVREFRNRMTPRRRVKIFELVVGDETGVVVCKWFNQPYLEKVFKTGQKVVLTGKPARNPYERFQVEFSPVSYEILSGEDDDLIHHGRIVPVYHETQGLTSRMIRKLMKTLLEEERLFSGESLPTELLSRHSFPPLPEALREVHFPSNRDAFIALPEDGGPFRKRLVFEDFFFLEIGLLTKKTGEAGQTVGISFRPGGELEKKMMESLPFSLTSAQRRVLDEIQRDMAAPRPMSRLLQ
ncbi:MAG TPA: OB-fold nucleic acid binding domain-containing protein, partial [Nitrospiria bacterium]|nr:OB-fold nucleic acid binding domain-containing protein [Nitrospiria bacterium]